MDAGDRFCGWCWRYLRLIDAPHVSSILVPCGPPALPIFRSVSTCSLAGDPRVTGHLINPGSMRAEAMFFYRNCEQTVKNRSR